MNYNTDHNIRLKSLSITNYKAIDNLNLEFQEDEELDIYALGSENGVGKTTVLNCIAEIATHAASVTNIISPGKIKHYPYKIDGVFQIDDIQRRIISNSGNIDIHSKIDEIEKLKFPITPYAFKCDNNITYGFHFLYLGSGRSISDGGIDIGKEVRDIDIQNEECDESRISLPIRTSPTDNNPSGEIKDLIFDKAGGNEDIVAKNSNFHPISISKMKREIIWCILKNIVLVKKGKSPINNDIINRFNDLLKVFSKVKLYVNEQDYLSIYNSVLLKVCDINNEKIIFDFDDLSSGQKEIISTLFCIWFYTRYGKSIVLIDEPELHLNMSWQLMFVQMLKKIAPNNQYIMATHSEAIMRLVPFNHRILLEK